MGDLGYPASPAELTPDWYTTALRSTGTIAAGTSVTAASAEPIGVGVGILSLLWRVTLTYEGGEGPATAVLKLPHTVAGARQTADAFSFYGREVNFYREVGHRTPLGHPDPLRVELRPGAPRTSCSCSRTSAPASSTTSSTAARSRTP